MKVCKIIFGLLFSQIFLNNFFAQSCGTCTVFITGQTNTSYTINAGETFCVDSMGVYSGSLVLNGGTICNRGTFRPQFFAYNSGSIINYLRMTLPGTCLLDSTKAMLLEKKSFLRITDALTIAGGVLTNKGICNVATGVSFVSGQFNNSGILNCKSGTGLTNVMNTGIINKD